MFCSLESALWTLFSLFFFFNDTATTEIYTLSLHDALPICPLGSPHGGPTRPATCFASARTITSCSTLRPSPRSEEHTSELQSPCNLVCRLLLEKKKTQPAIFHHSLLPAAYPGVLLHTDSIV